MTVVNNYSSLNDAVKSYCVRTDPVFTARLDDFIKFAESRIYNGVGDAQDPLYSEALRVREMYREDEVVLDADGVGQMPDRILDMRTVTVPNNPSGLDYLAPDAFAMRQSTNYTFPGSPDWYTVVGNRIKLWPGAGTMTVTIGYWEQPPMIDANNISNYVIERHGEVYLAATLHEAFSWLQAGDAAGSWLTKYRSVVAGLNKSASGQRHAGGVVRTQSRDPLGFGLVVYP